MPSSMFGRPWIANPSTASAWTSASPHRSGAPLSARVDKIGSCRRDERGRAGRVEATSSRDANTWGRGAQVAILVTASALGLAAFLLALEGVLALALRTDPRIGPDFWKKARREYYMRFERHIVQYLPECAEFDPRLAYRLEPGHCRFSNREYDDEIVVNSAGMRDRE